MTWQQIHSILAELMHASESCFSDRVVDGKTLEFFYHPEPRDRRFISIFSEDGTARRATLCVNGEAKSGASRLWRRLTKRKQRR